MGRPKGSPNVKDTAELTPSRCPDCGSTDRAVEGDRVTLEYGGTDSAGRPFTHIIRQRVTCADCGKARIDVSREYRPAK
jgi:DNA-directed RNA polymerase subunit RPC12/RpoP